MIKSVVLFIGFSVSFLPAATAADELNLRLSYAINEHNTETLIRCITEHNVDINRRIDRWQRTLLHRAVTIQSLEIVLRLLAVPGINVNLKDSAGFTPLSISVQKSRDPEERLHIPIIQALLFGNANIHAQNICNRSPLDIVYDLPEDDPDKAVVLGIFGIDPTAPKPPRFSPISLPELEPAQLGGENLIEIPPVQTKHRNTRKRARTTREATPPRSAISSADLGWAAPSYTP
jgi:hypothetical protein